MPLSVAAIVFSPCKKQVLLIQRKDVPVYALPGGGVEKGEDPLHAAIRETLEETHLTTTLDHIVGYYYPVSSLAHPTIVFQLHKVGGQEAPSEETLGCNYFPIDDLPSLLPPFYLEWIHDALQGPFPHFKPISSATTINLLKYLFTHPLHVLRFILARLKIPYNTSSSL